MLLIKVVTSLFQLDSLCESFRVMRLMVMSTVVLVVMEISVVILFLGQGKIRDGIVVI